MHHRIFIFFISLVLLACHPAKNGVTKIPKGAKQLSEEDKIAFGRTYLEATKEKILGNFTKAVELYKKSLTIDPYSGAANNEMGLAYNSLGETDLAFIQFKRASELDPSNYWYKISYATFQIIE